MTLPFEDVDVFIESTDNVLHSIENRGSTQKSVIGSSVKNSSRIGLRQAAGAVFMNMAVRIWKTPIISLLLNTF